MTAPVLQWTGGKRKLVPELLKEMAGRYRNYYEPFSGGLALFFALHDLRKFDRAYLADMNPTLVNFYRCLRDAPEELIAQATILSARQSEAHYYAVRASEPTGIAAAARMLYLNRTCFNALWRVNRAGKFNVPWCKKIKPNLVDAEALRAASVALQGVEIEQLDCLETIACAGRGDLVYADPPYFAVSETANFVDYVSGGFDTAKQQSVSAALLEAAARGARVVISNADTPASRACYSRYAVRALDVARNAGCKKETRGKVSEIIASAGAVRV